MRRLMFTLVGLLLVGCQTAPEPVHPDDPDVFTPTRQPVFVEPTE